jgi:ankyrin repeat protein
LLAALGLTNDNGNRDSGGVVPWVAVPRGEREEQTLETVKTAVDLGVDVNIPDKEGRTALDGAKNLKYPSVVKYLTEKGAKPGTGAATATPGRGRSKGAER